MGKHSIPEAYGPLEPEESAAAHQWIDDAYKYLNRRYYRVARELVGMQITGKAEWLHSLILAANRLPGYYTSPPDQVEIAALAKAQAERQAVIQQDGTDVLERQIMEIAPELYRKSELEAAGLPLPQQEATARHAAQLILLGQPALTASEQA